MASLYQLTGEYLELLNMLEDEEIDEQMILDTLEGMDCEIENKADNYAKLIKHIESNNDAIKKEVDRLNNRKTIFENRIKSLKDHLYHSMKITRKTKFTTELFSFNIQKNGGKRKLTVDVDVNLIPEDYRIKQPDVVNGDKLREYLSTNGNTTDDGKLVCEWAHLEPQTEGLRIK
jgi:FtsZ-binding cell division protein ZapB